MSPAEMVDILGSGGAGGSDPPDRRRDDVVRAILAKFEAIRRYRFTRVPRDLADDAAQNALMSLTRPKTLSTLRTLTTNTKLFAYVAMVYVRELRRLIRRRNVDAERWISMHGQDDDSTGLEDILPAEGPSTEEAAARSERVKWVIQEVSALRPIWQRVLQLRLAGHSYDEIADDTGITANAARIISSRAGAELRQRTPKEPAP